MANNTQLNQISREAGHLVSETFQELKQVAITSEERLRRRIRSSVRIAVASVLFCISGIVSFGVNVTTALANKTGHTRENHSKAKSHQRHFRWHKVANVARQALSPADVLLRTASTGVASWYGGFFQHRKTASGKRFDTNTLMAAHKTLPFGTKVRVTNLSNLQSVIVEITDRGPYVGNRIIDLSHAAAVQLGFVHSGTAKVKLEIYNDVEDVVDNVVNPSVEVADAEATH